MANPVQFCSTKIRGKLPYVENGTLLPFKPKEESMINLLMHDNILVRIGSTIAFTLVLLAIIWLLSSLFLPPGLVKLGFVESLVTSSPHTTTAQILGANMLLGAFGLILMNQWHDPRGLATGYYIHFFRSAVFHGLLRGTNSFAFPYPS